MASNVIVCSPTREIVEKKGKELRRVSRHVSRFIYNVNVNKKQVEALLTRGNKAKLLGCPKKVRIKVILICRKVRAE